MVLAIRYNKHLESPVNKCFVAIGAGRLIRFGRFPFEATGLSKGSETPKSLIYKHK
jgi:hypothetical protein